MRQETLNSMVGDYNNENQVMAEDKGTLDDKEDEENLVSMLNSDNHFKWQSNSDDSSKLLSGNGHCSSYESSI